MICCVDGTCGERPSSAWRPLLCFLTSPLAVGRVGIFFFFLPGGRTRSRRLLQVCRLRLKCDGTRAETTFRLSAKRTSPFKSAGASVQSTTGSRGVRISGSNAGYTMFRGSRKSTGYFLQSQFPLHFPSRASPCAFTFQLDSTSSGKYFQNCQKFC